MGYEINRGEQELHSTLKGEGETYYNICIEIVFAQFGRVPIVLLVAK